MLYVEDSDGSYWLSVAEVLSEREALDMVLCLYPDSAPDAFPEPFTVASAPEPLERVSEYLGGNEPSCSGRVRVSAELVDVLRPHIGEFEEWADSLSLHPPRELSWAAAFIPYERVVIVRDERLQGFLDAAGIPVGTERPEGW